MPSNEKDTDGLSFPDDATLARLRAEVDPPNPADWADAQRSRFCRYWPVMRSGHHQSG
jgi:hypothetical protein